MMSTVFVCITIKIRVECWIFHDLIGCDVGCLCWSSSFVICKICYVVIICVIFKVTASKAM